MVVGTDGPVNPTLLRPTQPCLVGVCVWLTGEKLNIFDTARRRLLFRFVLKRPP